MFLFPATAHAYLDPGSGSLVFQSLLALLFGIGASWRRLRAAAARLVFRLRDRWSRSDLD